MGSIGSGVEYAARMPGTRLGSLTPSSSSPSTARDTRRDTMRPLRRDDMDGRYDEKRDWAILLMGVPR